MENEKTLSENILWISAIGLILTNIFRAMNCGYRRESYFMSFIFLIPITFSSIYYFSPQTLLNVFHILISLLGYYRHKNVYSVAKI